MATPFHAALNAGSMQSASPWLLRPERQDEKKCFENMEILYQKGAVHNPVFDESFEQCSGSTLSETANHGLHFRTAGS
jgi:hypothetical protein